MVSHANWSSITREKKSGGGDNRSKYDQSRLILWVAQTEASKVGKEEGLEGFVPYYLLCCPVCL
jgi:hypothetical protein